MAKTKPKQKLDLLKVARKNFEVWNNMLQTKNEKKVASLYLKDNLFLPTVSGEFKKGISQAEGYFKHFLEKDPRGTIVEDAVLKISPNDFIYAGMYNFEVGPANKREVVEARFTFVYKKETKSKKWKISHHHSSVKPK